MQPPDLRIAHPPPSRAERVIAGGRVVLAICSLGVIRIDPTEPTTAGLLAENVFTGYLAYAIALVALVWLPLPMPRRWAHGTHAIDLGMFTVFMFFTEGPNSPFFLYFTFALIAATLRWGWRGTVGTGVLALVMFVGLGWYAVNVLAHPAFDFDRFIIRAVYLAVIATLLAYMAAHHQRANQELGWLASWPQNVAGERQALLRDALARVAGVLRVSHVAMLWEQPEEPWVNVAEWRAEAFQWTREQPGLVEFVGPSFAPPAFESDGPGTAGVASAPLFISQWRKHPLPPALAERFGVHAAPSWAVAGQGAQGQLFCLGKSNLTLDDVALGEVAVRLTTATLDHIYLLTRLREAVASEERVRIARNLHDSVAQSLAGVALQLQTARGLMDRDLRAAQARLREMQEALAGEQHRLRNLISDLRPFPTSHRSNDGALTKRLAELCRRVERQWGVRVQLAARDGDDAACAPLMNDIYNLINEALINAARHADASLVSVSVAVADGEVQIEVVDDGHGFPFTGEFDLATLQTMEAGPRSLKERVQHLSGELVLESSPQGARLAITLPLEVPSQRLASKGLAL
jgi:signal transduction histidine kinase